MSSDQVYIFDTTLRDGEQSPGVALSPSAKLAIAEQLARLGVDIIEAGFPQASAGDLDAVRLIAGQVREPVIAALARCHPSDIEAAARALESAERPRIHKLNLVPRSELFCEQVMHSIIHAFATKANRDSTFIFSVSRPGLDKPTKGRLRCYISSFNPRRCPLEKVCLDKPLRSPRRFVAAGPHDRTICRI